MRRTDLKQELNKKLESRGVEIVHEDRKDGSTTAYFYNDELIALKRDRELSIFPTYEIKVSDLYNIMLADTSFEHYISKGVNYITTEDNERMRIGKDFTWRVLWW